MREAVKAPASNTRARPICVWAALAVETVTDEIPGYKFELGKGVTLRDGYGCHHHRHRHERCRWRSRPPSVLAADGMSARVIDMHTIKPLDERAGAQGREGDRRDRHQPKRPTSWAAWARPCREFVSETCPVPVVRHGVNDEFGRSGAGSRRCSKPTVITAEGIVEKAKKAIAMKK